MAHSVRTIDSKQLMTKLLGVEHLIENFETREALNSCKDILKYNLNENIRNGIQEVLECLSAFDDDGAMQLLGNLYQQLKERE